MRYNEKTKTWIGINKGVRFKYSENSHGDYAKILAQLSEENGIRYNHYIEIVEDHAILHNYSKTYGYHDILLDICDVDKVSEYRWTTKLDKTSGCFYTRNKEIGSIHRYIMNLTDPDKQIDHINRDPRDNRRENLRIVDNKMNSRNRNNRKNSSFDVRGVTYSKKDNMFYARIETDEGTLREYFSCKKLGYEQAMKDAIEWRKIKEKENGYI